jgi:fructose-bisphosphate aldolase class I
MAGYHTIEQCYEVTRKVLTAVFIQLKKEKVDLSSMLLKPNMVIYSLAGPKVDAGQVAENTLKCLSSVVPPEVPGIVFLSGGQSEEEACKNLDVINKIAKNAPWKLSFSYGRALQNSTLKAWGGKEENISVAQEVFVTRAKAASLAAQGKLE